MLFILDSPSGRSYHRLREHRREYSFGGLPSHLQGLLRICWHSVHSHPSRDPLTSCEEGFALPALAYSSWHASLGGIQRKLYWIPAKSLDSIFRRLSGLVIGLGVCMFILTIES